VDPTSPDPIRLGGIGKWLSNQIEDRTEIESRYVVLGHVQRGGTPCAGDRVLATQFGHHAMTLLRMGKRNRLVVMQGGTLTDVEITAAADKQRLVPVDHPLIEAARGVGAETPGAVTMRKTCEKALKAGDADNDIMAITKVLKETGNR
jgi:6-phosphofructokinase 1